MLKEKIDVTVRPKDAFGLKLKFLKLVKVIIVFTLFLYEASYQFTMQLFRYPNAIRQQFANQNNYVQSNYDKDRYTAVLITS